jgi:predicted AAA+ superfamily ATPase
MIVKGFYEEIPKVDTLPRKMEIERDVDTLLQGITQSGKTSLMFDYIGWLPEDSRYLYIDSDEVEEKRFSEKIVEVLKRKRIEYLFIDIYGNDSFIERVKRLKRDFPALKQIVISSWRPHQIDGFQLQKLYPLSFEEFLVFKNSIESVEHTFIRYTKVGGFPIFAKLSDSFLFKQVKRLFYFALTDFEIEILKDIANHIGIARSKFEIFNSIKRSYPISKDKFYRVFEELLESSYIVPVNGFDHRYKHRFYFIDSALKNSFGEGRNFAKLFENLVLSELYKRGVRPKFYKKLDFYIEGESRGVQPKPFIDNEEIVEYSSRLLKEVKDLKLKRVEIVTMGFDSSFKVDGVYFEAIQFTRWALL